MAWPVDPCPAEFASLFPPYHDCPTGLTAAGDVQRRTICPHQSLKNLIFCLPRPEMPQQLLPLQSVALRELREKFHP